MKRTNEHVKEDRSYDIFMNKIPAEWVRRKIEKDYGVDIELEVASGGEVTGKHAACMHA